ncbi:hypothetical protein SERLADRAFT_472421 [Serpula lacrymans var. lacrymans S7.9]|uniref:Cytochrome P450 n=1 Tax=Serpula lacrymans var. lacrymans (strain S7.9) TaxID=578457 RepID=F8P3K3_SERL9|nr:uncharacterized protein SERLADRAFT_472421 [Serpula lacrymans var. lacrymans S7.9]EGO22102.1 hypothetical protein SERLADRAFT_472421 [Serpula lacrymans var. lacrymans S7.9]
MFYVAAHGCHWGCKPRIDQQAHPSYSASFHSCICYYEWPSKAQNKHTAAAESLCLCWATCLASIPRSPGSLIWSGQKFMVIIYPFTQPIIVVNSEKVANDLLERRASNYSDRPQFNTTHLFGWGFTSIFFNYGNRWRLHRRLFQQAFRADAALTYRPVQLRKVHQLLANLLETPGESFDCLQMLSAAIIMEVTYRYDPAPRHDPLVMAVERTADILIKALRPEGAVVFSVFPFCDTSLLGSPEQISSAKPMNVRS